MAQLTVSVVGTLILKLDDKPLDQLRQRKSQALLVYLLCHAPQPFSREHLETLLWSESTAERARTSLRQTLFLLRQALPSGFLLEENGGRIGIDPNASYTLDLDHLETDISLYRGEFLLGFSLRKAAVWDEWLLMQREQVSTRFISGLDRAAQRAQQDGRYDLALSCWQRVLEINRWHEQTHRAVMQAYAELGDHAAALEQYQMLCQILDDDLGSEPSDMTQQLAEQIRRGVATKRNNLPRSDTPFFGRESEIEEVLSRVLQQERRLITLVGLGGIGKTRLAQEIGRRLLPHYPHGVWLIELAPVTQVAAVWQAIGQALTLEIDENKSVEEALLARLVPQKVLLIFDNFEHLLEGRAVIKQILATCPQLQILITSREPLQLSLEEVILINGLTGEGATAGVDLFVERAKRVDAKFMVTAEVQEVIRHICQLLEGMPLGIELAAAWVRLLDVATIAQEIERDLIFLSGSPQDRSRRQQGVAVVFEQSLQRLTPEERDTLCQLAVFQPGFDQIAARAVTGATLFTLLSLVDKALLQRIDRTRFRLHERLRQYLRAQDRPWRDYQSKHGTFYATWLQDVLDHLKGDGQAEKSDQIGRRRENIWGAWHWAVEVTDRPVLLQMIEPLSLYFKLNSRMREGFELFADAQKRLQATDLLGGWLEAQIGSFLNEVDLGGDPIPHLERALGIAEKDLAADLQLFTLNNLAVAHAWQNRLDIAYDLFQQALQVAQQNGDRFREAGILNNLARLADWMGNIEQALRWSAESVDLHRALSDRQGLALALDSYANHAEGAQRYDLATQLYRDALHWRREVGDKRGEADTLNSLMQIGLRQNDLGMVEHYLQEAAVLHEALDVALEYAVYLARKSHFERRLGRVHEGVKLAEEAVRLSLDIGRAPITLTGYQALALAWADVGSLVQAEQVIRKMLEIGQTEQINSFFEVGLGTWALCDQDDRPLVSYALLQCITQNGDGRMQAYCHVTKEIEVIGGRLTPEERKVGLEWGHKYTMQEAVEMLLDQDRGELWRLYGEREKGKGKMQK